MARVGLIGGTGLESLNLLRDTQEIEIQTPYGATSSTFIRGTLNNCELYILSRHGREHTITPTHVNNLANIDAFRQAGCDYILATSACGSLREEIGRGILVIPDQFIDFTRFRKNTFFDRFEPGKVSHTAMAEPFSGLLRKRLITSCEELGLNHHPGGTIITIEGPRFSTRAESVMFRAFGADVINMSTAPEAILANEAGIPYAVIALSTDFDSWKHDEAPVTWDDLLKVFNENVKNVTTLLLDVIRKM
ncbi:MAG: MTAP family purine nucleoside phosphorylase [bacterium]